MNDPEKCPVCKSVDEGYVTVRGSPDRNASSVDCSACGRFLISSSAAVHDSRLDAEQRRALSNSIRWRNELSDNESDILVTSTMLDDFRDNRRLPTIDEQVDNIVRFLALRLRHMGREYPNCDPALISAMGAIDREGAIELISALIERRFLKGTILALQDVDVAGLTLTLNGWLRAGEIEKGSISEQFAFMAMQYGDPELEEYVESVFRPTVKDAGFDLEILRDRPQAGVIDNYLRSRLRLCKFVIADLSHANNGAYWEAGFAEGLGKPVIYTCHQGRFESNRTHFDTNHSTTIVWIPDQPDEARRQLLACIRNSIPDSR